MDVLFDKIETRKLAMRLGIPVAAGLRYAPGDDPGAAIERLGLPLVLKPTRSYRLENLQVRADVSILPTRAEAEAALAQVTEREVLLEAYFPGMGVGVSLLAAGGQVFQYFQHVRVHPSRTGSSGYRRSEKLDARLVAACERIVAELRYTGVVMFEFREDPDTLDWVLLEGNARPWGSLPLPVSVGVDFPYWWMELVLSENRRAPKRYTEGRYARNLTADAYYLVEKLRANRHRPLRAFFLALSWFAGLLRILVGIESHDTLVRDDPRPGFDELTKLAMRAARKVFGRAPGDVVTLLQKAWSRSSARPDVPIHIEFVCLGNICRSPYAERLFSRLLPEALARRVTAGSSGSLALEGRRSPDEAVRRAREREDVDLTSHRSRYLTEELVAEATLLVVFEERNEENVLSQYPHASNKLLWLGDFLEGPRRGRQIDDPYGKGAAAYDRAYELIEDGVKEMVQLLGRTQGLSEPDGIVAAH